MTRAKVKAARSGEVTISRTLQLAFIGAIFGSWAFGQLSLISNVWLSGSYISMHMWWVNIMEIAFALALLGIGYVFADRVSGIPRLFDASLRALIGMSAFGFVTMINNHIVMTLTISSGSAPPAWQATGWLQAAFASIILVAYTAGQYWWANRKRRR